MMGGGGRYKSARGCDHHITGANACGLQRKHQSGGSDGVLEPQISSQVLIKFAEVSLHDICAPAQNVGDDFIVAHGAFRIGGGVIEKGRTPQRTFFVSGQRGIWGCARCSSRVGVSSFKLFGRVSRYSSNALTPRRGKRGSVPTRSKPTPSATAQQAALTASVKYQKRRPGFAMASFASPRPRASGYLNVAPTCKSAFAMNGYLTTPGKMVVICGVSPLVASSTHRAEKLRLEYAKSLK